MCCFTIFLPEKIPISRYYSELVITFAVRTSEKGMQNDKKKRTKVLDRTRLWLILSQTNVSHAVPARTNAL